MKLVYSFSVAVCLAGIADAQPTITSAFAPSIGDVFNSNILDTTSVVPGPSGANQSWDFSKLTSKGTSSTSYIDPTTTPYASSYPGTTVAVAVGSDYYYYSATSSGYYYQGNQSGTKSGFKFSNTEQLMAFPFTYNSTFNDIDSAQFFGSFPGNNVFGPVSGLADAYGTLKVPGAIYTNALRVKLKEVYTDTSFGLHSSSHITSTTYSWYVSTQHNPVFTIVINSSVASGLTSALKSVSMSTITTGINESKTMEMGMQLYPNPAKSTNAINMSYTIHQSSDIVISIFNALGQQMTKSVFPNQSNGFHTETIQLNGLSKGIYTVRIQGENALAVKNLVVE